MGVATRLPNLIDNPAAIAAAISFGRRVVFSDELANAGPHLLVFPFITFLNGRSCSRARENFRPLSMLVALMQMHVKFTSVWRLILIRLHHFDISA